MSEAGSPLAKLTVQLLEREGAVVEWVGPGLLEVLAPPHIRRALDLPELGRLAIDTDPPPGARHASLESDFIEALGTLLGLRGRRLRVAVPSAGPAPFTPARMLEKTLVLENATYRLIGVERAWTTYAIPTFRYVARSDDQREGLFTFGLNAGTMSVLDEVAPLLDAPKLPCDSVAPEVPQVGAERLAQVAACLVPEALETRLAPFLAGMRRRLGRDAGRLLDYYGRLRAESLAKLDRIGSRGDAPATSALARREDERLGSIAREHRAKLDGLRQRYALVVDIEWVQTLEIVAPVHRMDVEIRRRKKTRRVALDVNPFTRRLEGPPCEHRHAMGGPRVVCEDAFHLVSRPGHAPCPACERPYCRVCHPVACPRCRRV